MAFRRQTAFAVLRVQPHALLFPLICLLFPRASPSRGTAAAFSLGLDLRLAYTPRHFNSRVFRHASVGYHSTAGKGRWALAASKDWRAYGVVAPVRQQGTCAASWAIASLAAVECARAIATAAAAAATRRRSRRRSRSRSSSKEGWFGISSFNRNRSTGSSSRTTTSTIRNSYGGGVASGGYGGGGSTHTPSPPTPLSVQQVLSCQGTFKCNGGLPSAALDYVVDRTLAVGGVYAASSYPYAGAAAASATCKAPPYANPNQGATAMFEQVPEFFGWFGLLLALQRQPVVVGVMGGYPSFQKFTGSGVYADDRCERGVANHAVLVVGYVLPSLSPMSANSSASPPPPPPPSSSSSVSVSSGPHWIIRNSWGTAWGDNGDMRMAMVGGNGICEIHSTPPLYPVVASGSPCKSGINPCGGGQCVPVATAAAAAAVAAAAATAAVASTQSAALEAYTGVGVGARAGAASQRYLCNCPRGFVRTTGIDGSQSCTPVRVCSFYAANPCGVGVCINDGVGGYGCVCPSGWTPAKYGAASTTAVAGGAGGGSWTCVRDVKESKTYTVGFQGVTCGAVVSAFGLSLPQLLKQNPRQLQISACGNVGITVGTVLNVTRPTTTRCTVRMSWGEGDSCQSVLKRAEVPASNLSRLNPWLNCSSPPPAGFQVCISTGDGYWNIPVNETGRIMQVCTFLVPPGIPPDRPFDPPRLAQRPAGGAGSSAGGPDLCKEVQAVVRVAAREIFALNPGIYCRNLAPTVVTTGPGGGETFELVTAQPVCVSGSTVFIPQCPVVYRARAMDTCASITARFFSRQPLALANLNGGWRCIDRALTVGRPLCVPAGRPPVSGCKKGC